MTQAKKKPLKKTNKKKIEETKEEKKLTDLKLVVATIIARELRAKNQYEKLCEKVTNFEKTVTGLIDILEVKLKKYEKVIKEATEINTNVEATLRNVHLAIRQNEYLQAWYPAQQGFPEMKVIGKHPAVIKRESSKK